MSFANSTERLSETGNEGNALRIDGWQTTRNVVVVAHRKPLSHAPQTRERATRWNLEKHKENGPSGQRKGRFKAMNFGGKRLNLADIEAAAGIGAVIARKGCAALLALEPAVEADAELFAIDRPDA